MGEEREKTDEDCGGCVGEEHNNMGEETLQLGQRVSFGGAGCRESALLGCVLGCRS